MLRPLLLRNRVGASRLSLIPTHYDNDWRAGRRCNVRSITVSYVLSRKLIGFNYLWLR
jgi:hypothetical protein